METQADTPESSNSSIRAGRALLVLFVIALAVSAYIHFGVYGYSIEPRPLGKAFGGALALVALPSIVIVPWRLVERILRIQTNYPILVGSIFFAGFAFFSLVGAMSG